MTPIARRAVAALALVVALLAASAVPALAAEFQNYAVASVSASLSTTQAGAHADFTTSFELTQKEGLPYAATRELTFALPPGVLGNPQAFPRCTSIQLGPQPRQSECPQDSQVGVSEVTLGGVQSGTLVEPVYNMQSPGGDVVARLGLFAGPEPLVLNVRVDPRDYGLLVSLEGPLGAPLIGARTTLWGVPAAPSHDALRLTPQEAVEIKTPPGGRKSGLPEAPFMTNPTSCRTQRQIEVTATSYQMPEAPSSKTAEFPAITGCGALSFEPRFSIAPTNPEAAAPTGIEADLQIPQDETPQGRATSALESAVVTLPQGLTINPSAADGLEACSAEQVGFESSAPAACPGASKIGSAEIEVPPLEHVIHGSVFQRTPTPGHLFRFWLVSDELGVHLKLPAEIEANPLTGQITTRFEGVPSLGGNPQVPVADLKLDIFGGPRAPLSTPAACGTYQTNYRFVPWSGTPAAVGEAAMSITSGCGKGGFGPGLLAGTLDPSGGRYSPFVFEVTRRDGEANPQSLEAVLPEGLLAKLGGIPLCPEQAAATAACPPASQVGTVAVAAGVGGAPLWVPQPGKTPTAIYLAGPYKGAPYSLIVMVPAQAGPFDLGTVVTRAGIYVDPETARARIVSDPLPQILEGVPVAYRAVRVDTDHPEFTLNPTSCAPKSIEARVTASDGESASPTVHFQATNCAELGFKPKLKLQLKGATKRSGHPALKAVVTYPKQGAYANIARAQVGLPHSEFLDQGNLDKVCTRPELRSDTCPKKSIYGHAKAWTPLLDKPLEGPVYLGVGFGYKLPALVVDLNGKVRILLKGKVDTTRHGGIRNTFEAVPDAPVSRFVLELKGGKKYGLLENSENICRRAQRASALFTAQNGLALHMRPTIANDCGTRKKKGGSHRG